MKLHNPTDRDAYIALIQEACDRTEGTGARVALVAAMVADAVQAHRPWAVTVQDDAMAAGFARDIKTHLKRARVVVALGDRRVSKTTVVGVRRRGLEGNECDQQLDLLVLTFDELRSKARWAAEQSQVFDDSRAMLARLLTLQDRVPAATTVEEALLALHVSMDAWLGEAVA